MFFRWAPATQGGPKLLQNCICTAGCERKFGGSLQRREDRNYKEKIAPKSDFFFDPLIHEYIFEAEHFHRTEGLEELHI